MRRSLEAAFLALTGAAPALEDQPDDPQHSQGPDPARTLSRLLGDAGSMAVLAAGLGWVTPYVTYPGVGGRQSMRRLRALPEPTPASTASS
ncbi:MAG: hypothetical protein ACXWNI_01620 [Candidatus Limnocylindrales bacterium]